MKKLVLYFLVSASLVACTNQETKTTNSDDVEKTRILTMLYRSHLTIFSIDYQHKKGSKKNAMRWSTTAYFPPAFKASIFF
jgi:hypothetical protein